MRLSFFIAKRYLISKKSHNLINIISLISVIGLVVGTMALIVVLSVFNGFEDVIQSMYNTFNPDYVITAKKGKTFNLTTFPADKLSNIDGVIGLTEIVEEDALFKYGDKQHIARLKGVSENFTSLVSLDTLMVNGSFVLKEGNSNFAVVGAGVAWYLDIYPQNISKFLSVYVPKRGNSSSVSFGNAFNNMVVHPSGVFSVQQEFDEKYVLVPIGFVRELMDYSDEVTSVEIRLGEDADVTGIKTEIEDLLGSEYVVLDRAEQNKSLFNLLKSEKLAIFFILVFILILLSFNMIGSLSILILEKSKDVGIMSVMGADRKLVRRIFMNEGLLISFVGSMAGLLLGFVILFLQQQYGLIQLGGGDGAFIISAYPVKLQLVDFVTVFITVMIIGFIATIYPVIYLVNRLFAD